MAIYEPPIPVTIAAGQSLSPEVDVGALTLVGIWMPATWTAANLTFQVAFDNTLTFVEHYNSAGVETTFTAAASQYIAIDPLLWRGVSAIKVRSGTLAGPVTQAAAATLNLIARAVL
jgi:hypothetical protein